MVTTGVPSLDNLLGSGGYPERSLILIEGTVGTQKERLGYKFMDAGLSLGEFCLYITRLSARDARLEGIANGLTEGKMPVWIASEGGEAKFNVDDLVELSINTKILLDKNSGRRIRIVLDFLSPLLILNQPEKVYSFLSQLFSDIKQRDAVLLATLEEDMHKPEVTATIEDLFDGVICLSLPGGASARPAPLLSVKKMRGVRLPVGASTRLVEWGEGWTKSAATAGQTRIAVLPLANYSLNSDDDYFADGMTEELISSLSSIRGLSVISRTSAMKFKDVKKTAAEIGRELNVEILLEGSVRKSGNVVRITVQLVDAANDQHLWAENYDRNLEDIFAVQSEIAEKVASSLQVKLLEEDRGRIEKPGPRSVEAYTLMLKGRFHLNRWDKDSLLKAIKYFEDAIAKDPYYAAAYAGLAHAYSKLGFEDILNPREAYRKAEEYVRRALELDESLPEAHAALGGIMVDKHDFASAIVEFKRALELNPNLVDAHLWQASVYAFTGKWEDCLREVEEALQLDPLSVDTTGNAGTWYLYARQYDKAVKHLKDAVELDPKNLLYVGNLGLAHIQQGMLEEGLEEVRRAAERDAPGSEIDLGYALVQAGKPEEAREILAKLLRSSVEGHTQSTAIVGLYASLGEKEKALEWLERAYEEQSGYLVTVKGDFAFESLWDEPRFQAVMKKMDLK